jgi:hypothetical protein
MKTINLSLETRKRLSVAAAMVHTPVPAVFAEWEPLAVVSQPKKLGAKVETLAQAELRRERVEAITRRAPSIVVTSKWTRVTMHFDAVEAVPLRLPLLQRVWSWLRTQD